MAPRKIIVPMPPKAAASKADVDRPTALALDQAEADARVAPPLSWDEQVAEEEDQRQKKSPAAPVPPKQAPARPMVNAGQAAGQATAAPKKAAPDRWADRAAEVKPAPAKVEPETFWTNTVSWTAPAREYPSAYFTQADYDASMQRQRAALVRAARMPEPRVRPEPPPGSGSSSTQKRRDAKKRQQQAAQERQMQQAAEERQMQQDAEERQSRQSGPARQRELNAPRREGPQTTPATPARGRDLDSSWREVARNAPARDRNLDAPWRDVLQTAPAKQDQATTQTSTYAVSQDDDVSDDEFNAEEVKDFLARSHGVYNVYKPEMPPQTALEATREEEDNALRRVNFWRQLTEEMQRLTADPTAEGREIVIEGLDHVASLGGIETEMVSVGTQMGLLVDPAKTVHVSTGSLMTSTDDPSITFKTRMVTVGTQTITVEPEVTRMVTVGTQTTNVEPEATRMVTVGTQTSTMEPEASASVAEQAAKKSSSAKKKKKKKSAKGNQPPVEDEPEPEADEDPSTMEELSAKGKEPADEEASRSAETPSSPEPQKSQRMLEAEMINAEVATYWIVKHLVNLMTTATHTITAYLEVAQMTLSIIDVHKKPATSRGGHELPIKEQQGNDLILNYLISFETTVALIQDSVSVLEGFPCHIKYWEARPGYRALMRAASELLRDPIGGVMSVPAEGPVDYPDLPTLKDVHAAARRVTALGRKDPTLGLRGWKEAVEETDGDVELPPIHNWAGFGRLFPDELTDPAKQGGSSTTKSKGKEAVR